MLNGIPVYLCDYMCDRVQYRFPKTKKKRIRKKWAKRPENYKIVPQNKVFQVGNALCMHPLLWEELKRQLNNEEIKVGRDTVTYNFNFMPFKKNDDMFTLPMTTFPANYISGMWYKYMPPINFVYGKGF